MKKLICMAIVFAMAFAAVAALAETETYTDRADDFTFTYDTDAFEIAMEDYQSDEDDDLVLVLSGKDEAWGEVFIQMTRTLLDVEDEEAIEAYNEAEEELISGLGATKGEWNGFNEVLMYTIDDEEFTEQTFVIPCTDDETLTILIHTEKIEDEEAAMARDDQISAVLDSLAFVEHFAG